MLTLVKSTLIIVRNYTDYDILKNYALIINSRQGSSLSTINQRFCFTYIYSQFLFEIAAFRRLSLEN